MTMDKSSIDGILRRLSIVMAEAYGDRLAGVFLFGSRARGTAEHDSDIDVAVVLTDGTWSLWEEKRRLIRLALPLVVESGLYIQMWPFRYSDWTAPEVSAERFVRVVRRDARRLQAAA